MPESESELSEAQVNLIEVSEDPNQSSEEPKASLAQEGKPRNITPILTYATIIYIYGIVH